MELPPKKTKCFTDFYAVKPKNHMLCYNVVLSALTRWVVIYHCFTYNWFTLIFLHLFRNLRLRFFMCIIWESTKLNIDDKYYYLPVPFKVFKKKSNLTFL